MAEEQKTKGQATSVEIEENYEPDSSEIKKVQKMAREVSPLLLELFEAQEEESTQ